MNVFFSFTDLEAFMDDCAALGDWLSLAALAKRMPETCKVRAAVACQAMAIRYRLEGRIELALSCELERERLWRSVVV